MTFCRLLGSAREGPLYTCINYILYICNRNALLMLYLTLKKTSTNRGENVSYFKSL